MIRVPQRMNHNGDFDSRSIMMVILYMGMKYPIVLLYLQA